MTIPNLVLAECGPEKLYCFLMLRNTSFSIVGQMDKINGICTSHYNFFFSLFGEELLSCFFMIPEGNVHNLCKNRVLMHHLCFHNLI
jgi:hypothetical protein